MATLGPKKGSVSISKGRGGNKKQAEEFPNDEVDLAKIFITRSFQQYE